MLSELPFSAVVLSSLEHVQTWIYPLLSLLRGRSSLQMKLCGKPHFVPNLCSLLVGILLFVGVRPFGLPESDNSVFKMVLF